jgi:hypothetical protein
MKKKGNPKDLTTTLYHLKEENDRLREMAKESQYLEKLKQENKIMRLELQKMKQTEEIKSDMNSSTFEQSPSAYAVGVYSNQHFNHVQANSISLTQEPRVRKPVTQNNATSMTGEEGTFSEYSS